MFLSANSNICVTFRMVLMDCFFFFLLIMGYIFLLLYMPCDISLATKHCNFTLLSRIFCVFTDILEFRVQLSQFENSLIFMHSVFKT